MTQNNAPIAPKDVVIYGIQLISLIEKLHSIGLNHADIKPDNILINEETKVMTLIDFSNSFAYFDVDSNTHLPNVQDFNE